MVDGQHLKFNRKQVTDRSIDELIGLSHGLVADGKINMPEAEYLQKWLANRPTLNDHSFFGKLYARVTDYLTDDYLDEGEATDLFDTLKAIVGGEFELGEAAKSSTLPLCNPEPKVIVAERRFCFTGTFLFGKRRDCESRLKSVGGTSGSLTQKTNYLVIGNYATDSWKHSSAGNKILKAVEYRERGIPINIISEPYWLRAVESISP